jgi:hypothetical protein
MCAPNKIQGEVNTIRVDSNGAHIVTTREIEPSDCQAQVNRYEDFEAQTFEALYAACKKLVTRECDARVETDGQGVLRSCTWEGDDLCADNCGEGFHLRRWGFGDAPE